MIRILFASNLHYKTCNEVRRAHSEFESTDSTKSANATSSYTGV
jgi:hypothetical protein